MKTENAVVFFDGYCGLCNGFVDFCLKNDTQRVLRFSPLQGTSAKNVLSEAEILDISSIIVFSRNSVKLYKSEAVFCVLEELGGFWKLLVLIGRIFPRFIRDSVYDFIAKNRYSFFGKRDTCRLPTPEERAQFVD